MFSFGSKLLASALMDTTYNNIYTIVIGKCFSSTALGTYSRADGLAQFPSSNITGVLQSVTYPVLSSIQNEPERMAEGYKRVLRISAFVIFPLMVGLAAVADPFIRLILTDNWEGSIYYLQILCFALMWYPIHAINLNLLIAKGRSDYFLKLEIIKKILGVTILCVTIPMGLIAMCYGRIIGSLLCLNLNTYYTKKIIGYGYFQQMKDLGHIILHALVMGAITYSMVQIMPNNLLKLTAGIIVGGIYYIGGAYFMKFNEIQELISILKRKNR